MAQNPPSDDDPIEVDLDALPRGDREAWASVFRIIKPYVFARARTMTDGATCDDIVQQTLVAIWNYVDRGWRPASIDDITRRSVVIARNKARDQLRKRRREPFLDELEAPLQNAVEDTAAKGLDLKSLRVAFEACLAGLAEQLRLPICLRLRDELTFKQIGEQLGGEPLDTVYSRYNSGRKQMQTCLDSKGFGREFIGA